MTRASASSDLKTMARQLVESRTPAAYAGVEGYARRHAGSDAGALAWLAVGYAHYLDEQYAPAISALEKARPQAGGCPTTCNIWRRSAMRGRETAPWSWSFCKTSMG